MSATADGMRGRLETRHELFYGHVSQWSYRNTFILMVNIVSPNDVVYRRFAQSTKRLIGTVSVSVDRFLKGAPDSQGEGIAMDL